MFRLRQRHDHADQLHRQRQLRRPDSGGGLDNIRRHDHADQLHRQRQLRRRPAAACTTERHGDPRQHHRGGEHGHARSGPDVIGGTFTSQGHNLIGKTDGSSGWVGSDLTGTIASPLNPLLAPLGNYGGPTQTMALLPGSPAIDAGNNALAVDANGNPLDYDQRGTGFPRIVGGTVDIGAFEAPIPSSHVDALAKVGTSLVFPVTVTGTDAPGRQPRWTSPRSPSTSRPTAALDALDDSHGLQPHRHLHRQSNTVYAFYSVANDNAGNTQVYKPTVEASTDLPNLNTPATQVTSSSTYNANGTFTLNLTGTDAGGSGLAYFEVYVAIDAQTPVLIGPAIPAGVANSKGTYQATISYGCRSATTAHRTPTASTAWVSTRPASRSPCRTRRRQLLRVVQRTRGRAPRGDRADGRERRRRAVLHPLPRPQLQRREPDLLQAIVNSVNSPTRQPGGADADPVQPQRRRDRNAGLAPGPADGDRQRDRDRLRHRRDRRQSHTTTADGYYTLSFTPTGSQRVWPRRTTSTACWAT